MKYLLPLLLVALLLAGCNSNKDPLNQFRYAVNDSLIVAGRAGAMVLQEPLPPTLDNYSMETYEQVVMEEGIDVTYRYCTVKDSAHTVARLTLGDGDIVLAIRLFSRDFHTMSGIKVGSLVQDAIGLLPQPNIWYSYVSELFVLESPKLPGVQFIIDPSAYRGSADLTGNDMVPLAPSDFDAHAQILEVRLY